ncbi:hypothetical protein OG21DRAFT_1448999 [Imleria badia]|nr:hypothetical protein OG21DRAFT_1448999 [Imleria badia]
MSALALNCWIRGQDLGEVFQVKIPKTEAILELKKAIKNENAAFSDVDAHTLHLYKPKDPLRIPYEVHLSKFILLEHAEPLKVAAYELSKVFPEPPPKYDIHIIVDAPLKVVCWLRGVAPNDRFFISIRPGEDIDQFIRRIKDAQPQLRNVSDHHIRLYKIPGGDVELRESLIKAGDGEPLQGDTLAPNFLGVPVLDPLRVVIDVSTSTGSTEPILLRHRDYNGTADPIKAARVDFIQAPRTKKSPSDGSKPSAFRETQRAKNTQIPCGRPRGPEELIPVTLLHPVFGEFSDDCQTGAMTEDDNQFAGKLANALSDLYTSESDRVKALGVVFRDGHVNFDFSKKIPGTDYSMDASLSVDNPDLPPYCIAEFKNEVGSSTSEPYMQAVAYYLEATKKHAPKQSNSAFPCFLLVVFGPYIVFAGAAWNLRPVVQILSTPLAFNYHSTDTQNQLTVARHMAAFRKALRTLQAYYTDFPRELVNQSHNILFPYRTEFKSLEDGSPQTICYTKQFEEAGNKERLVFFGTLAGNPTIRICIKFARRYSKEAHLHCAGLGFAPKLRGFEVLPGGWYMIVMDHLVGYDVLADLPHTHRLPRSAVEAIGTQLKTLHARQMVHGDIRDTNVLVKKDNRTKLMLVDFDWAGVEGVVRYPPYVNYTDIQRPRDARDGQLIEAAHDLEMLNDIAETWAAKDS